MISKSLKNYVEFNVHCNVFDCAQPVIQTRSTDDMALQCDILFIINSLSPSDAMW